jgi:TPR repeat protein
LTNQSERLTGMHNINAESPMQILNDLHHHDDIPVTSAPKTPWHKTIFMISASWVTVIMALALWWFMATSMQLKNNQAMPTVTPLTSTPQPFASIENDIASVASDLITMDILEQAIAQSNDANNDDTVAAFDVIETVTSDAITMDRDLSLPADLKSLEDSAFDNIAEAQHDLAALYVAGQGDVTQNFERAGFWFKRAASQGIGNAAYNLGVLNQQGLGQPQNVQRALDWYRRAAQLGHPEAQYNLGIAYIEGIGTRYNPSIAAAFFQKAAFAGIVEAAYNIGLILENGLLGEVRTDDALKWYRGAAENGNTDAQKAFEVLVNSMKITQAEAGLLENGGTLSQFLKPGVKSAMMFQNAREDISLGTLVPTDQQILVSQIQEQLRKVRLYNGPQDGIVGAGTVKAIQSYQRQNNIPIDGKITDDLLSFMILQGTL